MDFLILPITATVGDFMKKIALVPLLVIMLSCSEDKEESGVVSCRYGAVLCIDDDNGNDCYTTQVLPFSIDRGVCFEMSLEWLKEKGVSVSYAEKDCYDGPGKPETIFSNKKCPEGMIGGCDCGDFGNYAYGETYKDMWPSEKCDRLCEKWDRNAGEE